MSLQTLTTKRVKAIKVKKMSKDEQSYGSLDSCATHNVREIKKEEDYQSLIPIEVEVVKFDSKVHSTPERAKMTRTKILLCP